MDCVFLLLFERGLFLKKGDDVLLGGVGFFNDLDFLGLGCRV